MAKEKHFIENEERILPERYQFPYDTSRTPFDLEEREGIISEFSDKEKMTRRMCREEGWRAAKEQSAKRRIIIATICFAVSIIITLLGLRLFPDFWGLRISIAVLLWGVAGVSAIILVLLWIGLELSRYKVLRRINKKF